MILQALKDYYDRMAAEDRIAPFGWEKKEIPFLFVIDTDGKLVLIEDTRDGEGKKKRAHSFLVPQSVKRASNIAPNFLWDNVEYVFGIPCKSPKKDRVEEQHREFLNLLKKAQGNATIDVVIKFLNQFNVEEFQKYQAWQDAIDTNAFVSFKIVNHNDPVFREPDIIPLIPLGDHGSADSLCLISGVKDKKILCHPAIKGVRGTNTTGGNIVSFNFRAVESYGHTQGDNAPVGEKAAFAYTTALNTLLSKDSNQKVQVGDATTVFWSDRKNNFEDTFQLFISENQDDPNALTGAVKALYQSVETGACSVDEKDDTKFFILGLSPNAARISVRFWYSGTVINTAKRFQEYFEDLRICHSDREMEHLSLWRLLVATAPLGKTDNISPVLAGSIVRSILEGRPFPESLLLTVLGRLKTDHTVSYARAKLIKGFLNRKIRYNKTPQNERSLTMSLDTENNNIGYRLGRLFAVLEKIQLEASPGLNATIRDRFYASASTNPSSVFANLMRLKNHHLAKLEAEGRKIYFERLIGEIVSGFDEFPSYLSLDDQGRFAIGYYHQNRDFFTKKTNTENNEDSANLL